MSNPKSNQLRAFQKLPDATAKFWKITVPSNLHREALTFLQVFEGAAFWKFNQEGLAKNQIKDAEFAYKAAVGNFRLRILTAYQKKDGSFFRALADVIEHGFENPEWSEMERFIYRRCWAAQERKLAMPYPSDLRREWYHFQSGPKKYLVEVQLKQIITTAKNLGFSLPRKPTAKFQAIKKANK